MNPGLDTLRHIAHPLAGVHGKVTNQLKARERGEREFARQIAGQRTAGEARLAVDQHRAGTADASAADEVELQRRILFITQIVQRDEEGHTVAFFELISLHVRNTVRILRVVTQDADLKQTVLGFSLGFAHFFCLLLISQQEVRRYVHCVHEDASGACPHKA